MIDLAGVDLKSAFALAGRAGFEKPFEFVKIPGGRNNQGFKLAAANGEAFLKAYFRHPDDPRDRQGAEAAFLEHAARLGLPGVPRVLGLERAAGLTLFNFVPGRKIERAELDWAKIEEAIELYLGLNRQSAELAPASEACFSLDAHLDCVRRRVQRLEAAAGQGMREDAAGFVRGKLAPAYARIEREITAKAPGLLGEAWGAELSRGLWRISPSDFGFHNALLGPDGRMVFLDFEYAGLDDPAKLACDFFCQPEVPVSREHLPRFITRICEASADDAGLAGRVSLLLPAYGLKWCCIMLNDFLALGDARRSFAEKGERKARQDRQLALARQTLQQLS